MKPVLDDYRTAPIDEKLRAMLGLLETFTLNHEQLSATRIREVMDAGVTQGQIRDAFYVGTSEIFGNGILRALARSLKLIPVDPDANLVPAMRAGAYGLRHGKVLILYPEGERSIDGAPKTFKKGAAILAAQLRVPIYPVAMAGFFEAWPRGKGFQKFSRLQIAFGDPVFPPQLVNNSEAAYDQLTAELKSRVVEMWSDLQRRQPS